MDTHTHTAHLFVHNKHADKHTQPNQFWDYLHFVLSSWRTIYSQWQDVNESIMRMLTADVSVRQFTTEIERLVEKVLAVTSQVLNIGILTLKC